MRGWKAAVVGAGFAAIVVLLGAGLILMQETPAPPVAIQTLPQTPGPEEITNKKKDEGGGSGIGRAKPEDDLPAATAVEPDLDLPANDGPDFAITDPVGYTVNLDFYRGRAFLFAVVSPDQNAAVANLEEIYSAFGSNPGIRILGVARQREDRFEGVRFPLYFNQGSKLLGVRDGEFLLLDKSGKEQLEGSLADSRNLTRIRSQLARLGIQQP
jgi:hypothetical protein